MNTCKTPFGTELPLINLKGKPYLQVAHRLVWLNENQNRFNVVTSILKMDKDESIVRAEVTVFNQEGVIVRSASATKREDSKGFADHLEKAETGAIGRALAILGYGTQFTLPDLDEGDRLADSPVVPAKRPSPVATIASATTMIAVPAPKANDASLATPSPGAVELATLASEPPVPIAKGTRPTFRRSTPVAPTKVPNDGF